MAIEAIGIKFNAMQSVVPHPSGQRGLDKL
jgi:hypothetical protein